MNETIKNQESRLLDSCRAIDDLYENYAKKFGLTYMSLTVLECIYEHADDCTQKLISEETRYPKQSVNMIIKSFYDEKYIRLTETAADRRNKKIVLTKKGADYIEKVILPLWKIDEAATEEISDEDRETFLKCIGIYEKSFRTQMEKLIRPEEK